MSKEVNKSSGPRRGPGGGGPPGSRASAPVEKAKDFKGTLKRLLKYLSPYRPMMVLVILMAVLSTVFKIASPRVMGMATDRLMEGISARLDGVTNAKIDFTYIRNILFLLGGLYLFSALFEYIQRYLMVGVTQKLVFNLRRDADEKLSKLPLNYYDTNQTGDILSRVTNDIDTISSTLQQSITQLITALVTLIGIIVMMLFISPTLTLITMISIPLSILATRIIAKKSQEYFKSEFKNVGELNGHIEEMYSGHVIVKAFGYEDRSIERFKNINEDLFEASYMAQFISGAIMPIMQFINNLGYIIVSVVGGIFVINKVISIGEIQAFIQYSRQFSQPIVQTADIANVIQSTIASAERVFEVLDEDMEIKDIKEPLSLENVEGRVEFENVYFSYVKDKKLIENMNVVVEPGETVAIVGPTGAGKTTLVNLLMRFYEIDSGKITIDGIDINDVPRGELRKTFGMVLQDTWLFNGTIRDNIAYGCENPTEERICEAAKLAQADYFIKTLPDGYDTVLNQEASNISEGQKQLLTIARAILSDPKMLILDEATSSVDTRTEILIQKAMDRIMKGRTSFVIAHRLSTIKNADTILVMDQGNIIEQGSHDELMSRNGFYADLYNSQFAA